MIKRCWIIGWLLITSCMAFGQTLYSSREGCALPPRGTIRILNLFINIVYDQTPERDPAISKPDAPWKAGLPNTINTNPPSYLASFIDSDLKNNQPNGLMTKLFFESSLGMYRVLGDFIIVDVAQSYITPAKPGANFGPSDLIKAAIEIINKNGFKTVFGHDSISDFDLLTKGSAGQPKKMEANGKIDYLQVCFRNTARKDEKGNSYSYGQVGEGEGNSYESLICHECKLKIGGKFYENEISSIQGVGPGDLSVSDKAIIFHEFAHNLFGSNAFHTSGGNHYNTIYPCVFMGMQCGYGLMGGYNSSLVSCNGYERWRMGWTDTLTNTSHFDISAGNFLSDISRADGSKTFILRDFVSSGDAIRIQFPYVDKGGSNQYLWLENHQVGKNGKLDFMQYSNSADCRQPGSAGIYAYIQVGKDVLESQYASEVYPSNQTDNLKIVSAKGNWDRKIVSTTDTVNCIAWRKIVTSEERLQPNPLTGYTDQQTHFFETDGSTKALNNASYGILPWIVYVKGETYSNLPYLGDNFDAFTGTSVMDIGSNPAPVNAVTCYVEQGGRTIKPLKKAPDTKCVWLSGLKIEMADQKNGTFKVVVSWDDYRIKNNVRWTGTIMLQEQLIVNAKKTILLDQGYTPTQVPRDSLSGFFAPQTRLTAENNSVIILEPGSGIILDHGSKLIIKSGSALEMRKGSSITVKKGCELIIEKSAKFTNGGGRIKVKKGGIYSVR
ncbi:MAG: hypothetical protein WCM76_14700 [Bacteroidota bacterium]